MNSELLGYRGLMAANSQSIFNEFANSNKPIMILAPTYPGDLVACRSVISELNRYNNVVVAVNRRLGSLVSDITKNLICYDLPVNNQRELTAALKSLPIPNNSLLVDLIGMPASWNFIKSVSLQSIGHIIPSNDDNLPYSEVSNWIVPEKLQDSSHFSVRMLRLIPEFKNATSWPQGVFSRAIYPKSHVQKNLVSLAPGCGKLGLDKRVSIDYWIGVSDWLRKNGKKINWFLGPDEIELSEQLIKFDDCVVSGNWAEVIEKHGRAEFGITIDTCHMHILAHSGKKVFTLFQRKEVMEWGGYPENVTCLCSYNHSPDEIISKTILWLNRLSLVSS